LIDSLNEINRLLITIKELSQSDRGALKSSVIAFCQNRVIEGKFPNHNETIVFSGLTGLIEQLDGRLKITALGQKVLESNPLKTYELNDLQKDLLVRSLFLDGPMKSSVLEILRKFTPAYSSKTFEWSNIDNSPLEGQLELLELLKQSGLLFGDNSKILVDSKYVDLVKELLKKPGVVSPEELFKRLKNAEVCGSVAETLMLSFEVERLRNINCMTEAECIQKISDLDASAGYDIASFDGQSATLVPNRFIEVKGSRGNEISFYWTRNEVRQAEIMRSKYWLYFVPGIDLVQKTTSFKPILIQDPFETILHNSDFEVDCMDFFVRKRKYR